MNTQPVVTVLMPVFNNSPYLRVAIESILFQTFRNFEFLLIDDGSTDDSSRIIQSYADSRIILVSNGANMGLVDTLNKGLQLARGRYVARMDADDISHPQRLARQVAYLENHPDVVVCGSWIKGFGTQHFVKRYPLSDESIRAHLLFESALAHPSIMIRREIFVSHRLFYDNAYSGAEDFELWTRIPRSFKFANIDRVLLLYRQHPKQMSVEPIFSQPEVARLIRKRQLELLGLQLSAEDLCLHVKISRKSPEISVSYLARAASWLITLLDTNLEVGLYDRVALAEMVGMYWWETCFHATALGFAAWECYFGSPLSRRVTISTRYLCIFWVKCLLKKALR